MSDELIGRLVALFLTVLASGFCLGAMAERVRTRPARLPKVIRDEIEEMIAG